MEEPLSQPNDVDETPSRLQWLWLAIPLLAVITLVIPWRQASNEPAEEDWSDALAALKAEIQPGDGVYVYPTWYGAPWAELEAVLETKELNDQDVLLHADPITDLEILRHPKIWILAPLSHELPASLEKASQQSVNSKVGLFLLEGEAGKPIYDFRKNLKNAAAKRISQDGKESRCRWRKDRHRCDPKLRFTDVRDTVGEVGNTRRRALQAHAWPDRGTLRITYQNVPLGKTLVVGVGLALRAVRKEAVSDATFRVLVNGDVILEQDLQRRDFDWHVHRLKTTTGKATVVFEVTTPEADKRLVYFDAVSVE